MLYTFSRITSYYLRKWQKNSSSNVSHIAQKRPTRSFKNEIKNRKIVHYATSVQNGSLPAQVVFVARAQRGCVRSTLEMLIPSKVITI